MTADDAVQFISGFLEGILNEDCSAIEGCVSLSEGAVKDIIEAIHQFSSHTIQGVVNGIQILLKVLQQLPDQISKCAGAAQVGIDLVKFLHNLPDFKTLTHKVFTNMLSHGLEVFRNIGDALEAFNNGDYKTCGKKLGDNITILLQ